MGIDGISSSSNVSPLDPLSQLQTQGQTSPPSSGCSTSSSVSGFAKMMHELDQLQQSDPTKFKEVTANIAKTLETDAGSASGSQGQFLTSLANRFEQASQTGSMSPFQPSGSAAGHHGHGHKHSGVQGYSAQQPGGVGSQQSPLDISQVLKDALQSAGVDA